MAEAAKKPKQETFTREEFEAWKKEQNQTDEEKKVRQIVREESRATFLDALKEFFGDAEETDGEGSEPPMSKSNPPKGAKKGIFSVLLGDDS